MPFSSLHAVELQLIMHHCDKSTLFALARSSKATLQAASADFAFSRLSPMQLNPTSMIDPSASNGLLRFCDVALTSLESARPNLAVSAALCVPRVHTFVSLSALSLDVMEALLRSPSMARLQSLSVLTVSEPMMALLADRLKTLRSLRIRDSISADCFAHLPALPQLTDLALDAGHEHGITDALPLIVACPQLRSVSLTRFTAGQIAFLLCSCDFARRLVSLDVASCVLDVVGNADKWSQIVGACTQLTSLSLRDCYHIVPVLMAAVQSCPRLESLAVYPDETRWYELWNRGINALIGGSVPIGGSIPIPSEIQQLLDARRAAIKESAEFAPLTLTLSRLSDAQVDEDYTQNPACRYHDWFPVRDAFVALVTPEGEAAAVRFELIEIDL